MTITATLRRLRHGPLRSFGPLWTVLGQLYRFGFHTLGIRRSVVTRIGPYGPFQLNGFFAFSNFEKWGGGHNDAFQLCIEACRDKACAIDVGAHIGLVALPMASVLVPQGRVICFEPAQANRNMLIEHAARNGFSNIEIEPWLVGEEVKDTVRFYEMDAPTGMNTVAAPKDPLTYRETSCRQLSLDSYCKARKLAPDVIKIDVEGAEIGVLRGARETISRCRPIIFLSVHPREISALGESPDVLTDLIDEMGYNLRDAQGHEPAQFELREYVLTPRCV